MVDLWFFDMWLVDGIDPLFQCVFYLVAMSLAWWLVDQAMAAPVLVVAESVSPKTMTEVPKAVQPPANSQLLAEAVPIPVWDDVSPVGSEDVGSTDGLAVVPDVTQDGARDLGHSGVHTSDEQRIDLAEVKIYRLRRQDVVRVADLALALPDTIRRYQLRQKAVVKVADLQAAQLVAI